MQVILTRAEQRKIRRTIRKVKQTTIGTLLIIYFIATLLFCTYIEHNYKIEAQITALNGYTYTAVDKAGYEWQFIDDTIFPIGTKVKLKMYDSCTTSRVDDEVRGVVPVK